MAKVTVDENACKGCGLCVSVCPKHIIRLSEKKLNAKGYSPVEITDMASCIGCTSCAKMCPDFVFIVEK